MNVQLRQGLTSIVLVGLAGLCPVPAGAAVRTYSIEQFNKSRPEPGVEVKVEGRVASIAANLLRFRNCDLAFRAESDFSDIPRGTPNLEVTGQINRESDDLGGAGRDVFRVVRSRVVPTDQDTFQAKRRLIRGENPADWYTLAAWAEERGQFYKDRDLLAQAQESRAHAISIEQRQATRDGPAALLALASKAEQLKLPDAFRQALVHESYHQAWRNSQTEPVAKLAPLLAGMDRDLPGSTQPLAQVENDLRNRYRLKPLETYESADAATRRKLHRLMYADVLLRTIVSGLEAEGKNGGAIADAIDRQVPEEHALAETFRDKSLTARASAAEKLSRRDMLALADEYVTRQQAREAERIKQKWLAARRSRLQPDDTEGLLQLADEYRGLLKDKATADRLLFEAYVRNPGAMAIVEQLERQGYHLKNGIWLSQQEFKARPPDKLEQALREGRVETGMTAAQVRQGLGEPSTLSRSVSANQVLEVWTYALVDSTQIAIHLGKRRGLSDLKVVSVSPLAAP